MCKVARNQLSQSSMTVLLLPSILLIMSSHEEIDQPVFAQILDQYVRTCANKACFISSGKCIHNALYT